MLEFIDELHNKKTIDVLLDKISSEINHTWTIMEVCGGQTHSLINSGLIDLLPKEVELIHGPGCPVCVTSLELVDKAIQIASQPNVIFASYGDMLRVPGSSGDLFSVRAAGGQVRTVYSALDAVQIARDNPDQDVVFFAIGFETTAPANAMSVIKAKKLGLSNYSILVSQVCVPPAITAILDSSYNRVQAFLAAGHVCSVMGYWQYEKIADNYKIPIVVTGFEPYDLARGILSAVIQLEKGVHKVENAYPRAVTRNGNVFAQNIINDVFEPCDRNWRGIGMIRNSGLKLKSKYSDLDAEKKYSVSNIQTKESSDCISGLVLQGLKKPNECPAFEIICNPENPLGATMVSSEGACAAYYRYKRIKTE